MMKVVLDVRGESFEKRAEGLVFQQLQLKGSDFDAEYFYAGDLTNTCPVAERIGMVRVENAADITVQDCRLTDAGYSAVWIEGWAQNVTIARNFIQRPGAERIRMLVDTSVLRILHRYYLAHSLARSPVLPSCLLLASHLLTPTA
jgi:hypothetical protein